MNVTQCFANGCKNAVNLEQAPTTETLSVPVSVTGSYSIVVACLVSAVIISILWYRKYSDKDIEEFDYRDYAIMMVSTLVISAAFLGALAFQYSL